MYRLGKPNQQRLNTLIKMLHELMQQIEQLRDSNATFGDIAVELQELRDENQRLKQQLGQDTLDEQLDEDLKRLLKEKDK
jgi:cell shape-determining protein MreC